MKINFDECRILHFGRNSSHSGVFLEDNHLITTSFEKDLDAFTDDLQFSNNWASNCLRSESAKLYPSFFSSFHCQLSFLHCASSTSGLYSRLEPLLTERYISPREGPHRAINLVPDCPSLPYRERLVRFRLTTAVLAPYGSIPLLSFISAISFNLIMLAALTGQTPL